MTEKQLQEQTARLMSHLGWLAWHTPNEGAQRLVRYGVLSGVSDWVILEPWEEPDVESGFGLAIELKVGKGRVTPEQTRFLAQCEARGMRTAVVRSYDEFVAALRYVRPLNGRRIACE